MQTQDVWLVCRDLKTGNSHCRKASGGEVGILFILVSAILSEAESEVLSMPISEPSCQGLILTPPLY